MNKHCSIKTSSLLLSAFFLMVVQTTMAQTKDRDNLSADEVNVVQEYKPTIADATKINENPSIKDSLRINQTLTYNFLEKRALTSFEVDPISPAAMKGDVLNKLYNNYFKVGLGNYSTPLLEAHVMTTRSKTKQMGLKAKHFSSSGNIQNLGFAGFSDNTIETYGKFFVPEHIIYGNVDYSRNAVHYYGFDDARFDTVLDKNSKKQAYNFIHAKAAFESDLKDTNRLAYGGRLGYYFLNNLYSTSEQNFVLQANGTKKLNTETYGLNLIYDYYRNVNSLDTGNAGIFTFNPYAAGGTGRWRAKVGLNLTAETDIGKVHFFPDVDFKYDLVKNVLAGYAGLKGNTVRNSYKRLSDINPFVSPLLTLKNTNTSIALIGGVRGNFSSKIAFDAGVDYRVTKDLPLYVGYAANILQNKFIVVYDDVNILNVNGLLSYQAAEKLLIYAKGNVYQYKTTTELRAWHKPKFDVTLSTRYSLNEKIIARFDLFVIGSQFALSDSISTAAPYAPVTYIKTLKGVTDVNIGLEYRYSKRISAFVNLNNIAGIRYQRWNNYPTYRFNFLAGLSFCF